ncbi:MAG: asparagine synthase (glutamine-hydrolyzing) [Verrucomicrobia bacterium]|nr:MAG: asparagine synthase (glutamine-hydrolyzing) [Verrucomicrobiota bacterium]
MCGIAGFTHKNRRAPEGRIQEAMATLHHRGPDQQGAFSTDDFSCCAARLKIIDLQCGNQPILENAGEWGIVFNGEVYNHLELRGELESLGHQFSSHSDTETVLKAFLQWDLQSLTRLRGMFAFAIWHKPSRRLVLARDRLGIKPLYYSRIGEDLYFGSELKALFVHPEIPRRLSLEGLDCYLALNYIPSPWTLIHGIVKLPPGEWLEWRDGAVSNGKYWELPYGNLSNISMDEATAELDRLMKDSVREHMISDVPLGVWLSGGVDSTSILHYASQATSAQLKTFSISFRGRSFDETQYVHAAVKQYNTDHDEMDLNPTVDLQAAIEEFAYYSDEPSADAGALPVWFLSRLCKRKTTVALSGEGADELFGGYLTYRADRMARTIRKFPRALVSLGLTAIRSWPVSDEKMGFDYKATRLLEGCLMPPEIAHAYWNGTFAKDDLNGVVRRPMPDSLAEILGQIRTLPPVNDDLAPYLWLDQKYYLADDILTKSDRMSMAHSVEVRPPFLDHRIVEFAAALPTSLKIQGVKQKVVLKQLMANKLPHTILHRKKTGFDIPAHEWLRGPLRNLLVETMRDGLREYGAFFHKERLEKLMERHFRREINVGYHLWGFLILFLWMKKWQVAI